MTTNRLEGRHVPPTRGGYLPVFAHGVRTTTNDWGLEVGSVGYF